MSFATAPIGMVFSVANGATPKSGEEHLWDGDIPWVTPADLGKNSSAEIEAGSRSITREGLDSCGTQIVPNGSIIVSIRAPIGHTAIATVPLCFNQGCRGLIPSKKVLTKFGYWSIIAAKPALQSEGQGTTFQELGRDKLRSIRISLPDLPTQRAIADFLDRETARIDLLIEKKQRLVALLGEKRSATVTAAVTGQTEVTGVGSRDCHLAEGGGGVSGKWRWIKLSHAYPRIGSGTTPPDEDGAYVEDGSGTNWVTTSELRESRICETKKQVSDDALRRYPTLRVYRPGSVMFAMYGATIGRLGMLDKPACCNQACCVFEHSKMVSNKYLVYWLQHRKNDLVALSVGGGQPNLSQQDLRNEKVYCPDLPTQRAIVDFLDRETGRLQQIQETTQQSIDRLKEYRSALITAAVTGQINVVKWDRAGSNERRLDALGDRVSA